MLKLPSPLRHVLDFCYPKVCAVCAATGYEQDAEICPGCFQSLASLEFEAACDLCGMPVAEHGALCPHCQGKGVRPFERIVRLSVFKDPVRHLIHQIKYHGRWALAEYLADRLIEQEQVKGVLTECEVLVPVPLHPWRQVARGYNQAEVLTRRLGRRCGIRVARPLVRLKNTETQTHLHARDKRFENLRDAFGVLWPRKVRGRHVVLVDDVMTTGATLASAARALAEAEPASISAVVVAVADPRGRDFEAI